MARGSKTTTAAKRSAPPAPKPADNRDTLSVAQLARGILSKEIRPRAGDVRRLADAALAVGKPNKDKKAKTDGGKKAKGKKKLAKIPGQKTKN
jgi:hypothetical protein